MGTAISVCSPADVLSTVKGIAQNPLAGVGDKSADSSSTSPATAADRFPDWPAELPDITSIAAVDTSADKVASVLGAVLKVTGLVCHRLGHLPYGVGTAMETIGAVMKLVQDKGTDDRLCHSLAVEMWNIMSLFHDLRVGPMFAKLDTKDCGGCQPMQVLNQLPFATAPVAATRALGRVGALPALRTHGLTFAFSLGNGRTRSSRLRAWASDALTLSGRERSVTHAMDRAYAVRKLKAPVSHKPLDGLCMECMVARSEGGAMLEGWCAEKCTLKFLAHLQMPSNGRFFIYVCAQHGGLAPKVLLFE